MAAPSYAPGAGLYYDSSVSIATDVLDGGPLNSSQLISGIHAPFSVNFIYGFVSGLKLPQVRQWNVSLDRALTSHDVVSLGYVGSNGRELIRREVGGPGSGPNSWLALTTNDGFSNYQALQFQYRRRFASGWQASAAYTWSHSIDNDSSDASLLWAGLGASPNFDFGSSDFDLRHAFNGSLSYQFTAGRLKGWRAESIVRARSGFPLTVLESEQYTGIAFTNFARPNYIGGPVWVSGFRARWHATKSGCVSSSALRRARRSWPQCYRRSRHVAGGRRHRTRIPFPRPVQIRSARRGF